MNDPKVEALFQGFIHPRQRETSAAEQHLLDQAEPHKIMHEGGHLSAWLWGTDKPAARRVLLVHGWESRASHWGAFIPALLAADFQVCAFDAPAHGESSGVQSDVIGFGRATAAVARHFGPLHAVIGHSAGSPAALYAFSRGVRVNASVHISGPSSLVRMLNALEHSALPAELRQQFRARFEAYLGQAATAMDLEQLQPGLRHPALIWHDSEDAEVPYSEAIALQQAWPQATLETVQGLGHRRILKDPQLIERTVNFLGAQGSDSRASLVTLHPQVAI
ncbi:alpha/beta hydrolase [Undibacterium sp.]|jgi:pimeloyl-ACP methyl ester carboxylesterase|uniref:alpha/beta hydrolase n=1 Tax=Undibacterium sp. TaxID=1914977 RepID=UPI002C48EE4C|nr:alpha/beta hydrolase [Undibacterium sp.]HTD04676.1 alpha/beta hydrolase [Undibacterium sp.]